MLTLDLFNYELPDGNIAQKPAEPRDSSKLLRLNKETEEISDHIFHDLPELLTDNDVIVRNNTKVIPARLFAVKTKTGGHVEILLTTRKEITKDGEVWDVLTKPGIKVGQELEFADSSLSAKCVETADYTRTLEFDTHSNNFFEELIKIGHTPIPPYIKWNEDDEHTLREVYQTTYAKVQGSAAAPTAGLHFTPELDQRLRDKGIQFAEVTLHVGLGTFLPVKNVNITDHHMHSEYFEIDEDTAKQLNEWKHQGKRIIAVGTTTVRALESASTEEGILQPQTRDTNIFMYPPYQFRFVDAMITNFHLPKSTLLMLISAFVSTPNTSQSFTSFVQSSVGKAYQHAIENNYRFFSFGDAMLIE